MPSTSPNSNDKVSVVIAAHNEEEHLEHLITQIFSQNHPNFEVIIVNDRSTDSSVQILENFQQKHPKQPLHIITIEEKPRNWNGKKYALQRGIEAAHHEMVLLTDADCLPKDNSWIKEMTKAFANVKTNAVVGLSFYEETGNSFLNWFIQNETILVALQYTTWANIGQTYMGVGRNLAYRKSMFTNKKGFSKIASKLGGDDDLWIGQKEFKNTTAVCFSGQTYSFAPKSWRELFQQKRRHLAIGASYSLRQKLIANILPLGLAFWYMGLFVLVWNRHYEILLIDCLRQLIMFQIIRTFCKRVNYFHTQKKIFRVFLGFELVFVIYYFFYGLFSMLFPPKKW